jgi:Tol biopolymer transport system component/tRNA A-37 threonylcarbamoyl transferase component Bud32
MGEVYRARDTRLGREVAIKVLPAERVADESRKRRFVQEARAASALNHPNIVTIYEIESAEGFDFIVMELVAGKTLDALIPRHGMRLGELLRVAIPLADALAAAHGTGIVHRDLKPANVMLTPEGVVKVLDFGLAKLTQAEEASSEDGTTLDAQARLSRTGTVAGTPAYMSPEQTGGGDVDARSDVFSFGAVLYEMATGRRAFAGKSASETLAAVVRDQPKAPRELVPEIPEALERLIVRCLRKEPERRYQHISDVKVELQEIKEDSDSAAATPAAVPARKRRAAWVAAGLLLLAGLITAVVVSRYRAPAVPRVTAIRQVTHDGSTKGGRVFSDGSRVYYTTPMSGGRRLVQAPVTGGDSMGIETTLRRPVIRDILPRRGELLVEEDMRFWEGDADPVWLVPTVGGNPRPLGEVEGEAGVSADEQHVVFAKGPDLFLAQGDGSAAQRILTAPGIVSRPRLSLDARRVRYTVQPTDGSQPSIWEAATDGSGVRPLLPGWYSFEGSWTPDGRYYLFAAWRDREVALWALPEHRPRWWKRTAGEPVKLTAGPMRYWSPTTSPDGRTVFAVGRLPSTGGELVRYDASTGLFVPFLGGLSALCVESSRDGRWVVYVRYPDRTLWRSRPDGSERLQLTFPPDMTYVPRWSPDAQQIAYVCDSPGKMPRIYVLGAGGGKPRPVLPGNRIEIDPTWSPDGARLLFGSAPTRTGKDPLAIWILDLRTGGVSTLPGSEGFYSPRWSPDGESVVALSADNTQMRFYSFATRHWREVISGSAALRYPNFTRDSRWVQLAAGTKVMRVRVADGQIEPVTTLDNMALVTLLGTWVGVASDDSPIALRERSVAEVYALDVAWP